MRKINGNSILTGAFCARSSAFARRRFRISRAMLRMICPIETPSVSPWMIERINELREVALDLFATQPPLTSEVELGHKPAEHQRPDEPDDRHEEACSNRFAEQDPADRQKNRQEDLVTDEFPRRGAVHAGNH